MIASNERGQVLPLTALLMTSLLLVAALAVDVTGVLSAERFYITTADAAALAGAQDLQSAKSRLVGDADRTRARNHAMAVLVDQLGATSTPSGGDCLTSGNVDDCALPGTPYLVSIVTPSPDCVSCEPHRSVQVTVREPAHRLTFAALAGQSQWNVEGTAVAGLKFSARYAIEALRPPHPLPTNLDQNRENISIDGTNTWVHVPRGDVGSNTSVFTNSGGRITLETGYRIDHIDEIVPDPWNQVFGEPEGKVIQQLIPEPGYMIASFAGAPLYSNQEDGRWDAVAGNEPGLCPEPGVEGEEFPSDYQSILGDPNLNVTCYLPGVYDDNLGFSVAQNDEVAYLLPGAYKFDSKGLDVGGSLMGGLVRGVPGVVLVIPQDSDFAGNNSVRILLNSGDETCVAHNCRALPAIDWASREVKSPEGLLITIEVPRDEDCFDGSTPLDVAKCTTGNSTLNLPGNGNLSVLGIVYAPSDNVQVNGNNTEQIGDLGQLISWTATYGGGAKLNLLYPEPDQIGIVRLDAACTGLEACTRP